MRKFLLVTLICLLKSFLIAGQAPNLSTKHQVDSVMALLQHSKADTSKVMNYYLVGIFYLYKQGELKNDLDSALLFLNPGYQLSMQLKDKKWMAMGEKFIGNVYIEGKDPTLWSWLKNVSDEAKVWLYLAVARYRYQNAPPVTSQDMDTAVVYANKAIELGQLRSMWRDELEARLTKSLILVAAHDLPGAKKAFLEAAELNKTKKDFDVDVRLYGQMAELLRHDSTIYGPLLQLRTRFMDKYRNMSDPQEIKSAQNSLIGLNFHAAALIASGRHKLAEEDFLLLIEVDKALNKGDLIPYYSLSNLYINSGLLEKALFYALEMEKAAEHYGMSEKDYRPLVLKGRVYLLLGRLEESIASSRQAISIMIKNPGLEAYGIYSYRYLVRALLKQNKADEALTFLDEHAKHVPKLTVAYALISELQGDCYQALGQYKIAEKYFLESINFGKESSYKFLEIQPFTSLAKVYIKMKEYEKSKRYLHALLEPETAKIAMLSAQEEASLLLFQIDTLQGNYRSAIRNRNRYITLHDSILNTTKSNQIADLEFKYETEKKDRDILGKAQSIDLLTKEGQLQKAELEQALLMRNAFVVGGIVLIIILFLLYNQYRLKQKTSLALENQQKKINQSNQELQLLNDQLQKLLGEKEWLVKEIHHRVKNNLQIVISLLNTQAAHLDEGDARLAIHESQSRIQVISLLHQKLYKIDNNSIVDMKSYIPELLDCIRDSFKGIRNFQFNVNVNSIQLDISQAVPIGLILNEAVTNSIKYAFLEGTRGTISISFKETDGGQLLLTIADNGVGLPPNFDTKEVTTLGMKLMNTLCEQLDGTMTIENQSGTVINLLFTPVKEEYFPSQGRVA